MFLIVAITEITVHLDEMNKQRESDLLAASSKHGLLGQAIASIAVGVILAALRHGAALFICENRTGLKNLGSLYVSGQLQSLLEECFTSLLVTDDPQMTVTVHIEKLAWELSDYCRCFLYFNPLPTCESSYYLKLK